MKQVDSVLLNNQDSQEEIKGSQEIPFLELEVFHEYPGMLGGGDGGYDCCSSTPRQLGPEPSE